MGFTFFSFQHRRAVKSLYFGFNSHGNIAVGKQNVPIGDKTSDSSLKNTLSILKKRPIIAVFFLNQLGMISQDLNFFENSHS